MPHCKWLQRGETNVMEGLYAPLPDVAAYLRRIGIDPARCDRRLRPELPDSPTGYSVPHTKETLDALIDAHLHHVPFENLDTYDLRREVSLEIPALFRKIVTGRRGGYCFELNALFFALLESLGFRGYPIAQRVLSEGEFPPLCHRSAVITLPGGKRLLCDVGYGGPSPTTTLYLDSREVQTSGRLRFRLDTDHGRGLRRLTLVGRERELPLLLFSEAPLDPVDFLPLNSYMTHNEHSCFYQNRMMNLLRADGSVAVKNDLLRIHKNGRLEERRIRSRRELREICIAFFGMTEEALADL